MKTKKDKRKFTEEDMASVRNYWLLRIRLADLRNDWDWIDNPASEEPVAEVLNVLTTTCACCVSEAIDRGDWLHLDTVLQPTVH